MLTMQSCVGSVDFIESKGEMANTWIMVAKSSSWRWWGAEERTKVFQEGDGGIKLMLPGLLGYKRIKEALYFFY